MKIAFDKDTLEPVATGDGQALELSQRSLLSGFGGLRFGDLPVGDALIGGASATLVSELIGGFIGTGIVGALVKLVAGNMLAGAFSGVLGRGATDSARLFITYDAIRDLLPLDVWVNNLLTGNGIGNGNGNGTMGQSQGQNVASVPYTGNGSVIAIDEWLKRAG